MLNNNNDNPQALHHIKTSLLISSSSSIHTAFTGSGTKSNFLEAESCSICDEMSRLLRTRQFITVFTTASNFPPFCSSRFLSVIRCSILKHAF